LVGISLDDAWNKLRWANKHFDVLRNQIEPFQQRASHNIRVEVDLDAGRYEFYITGLEVPDPDWGLMMGDCIHNARTALDYLMVRLWALVTEQDPKDVARIQFPIHDEPDKFASAVAVLRREPRFSDYLAHIEMLQPFNNWNPTIWDLAHGQQPPTFPTALGRLSLLDNLDKHRVVHATWNGVKSGGWFTIGADAPEDFKPIGGSTRIEPLEDGVQIGHYLFEAPLPGEWTPTQMQMKRYFPIQVAFPGPWPFNGVLEVLPWCLWGAETVLTIFAPVFERGMRPLPVTAIQTVRG
jgi:hypothetical protein